VTLRYTAVIPAFDAANTLAEALRSALDQTVPPARIIVVDDGSKDGTHEVAAAFGDAVEVRRQANEGPASATNAGLTLVETELVAFLDADDMWLSDKAERQLRLFADNLDMDGVVGQTQVFEGPIGARRLIRVDDNWGRTTLMFRTASARRIGLLRTDLPGHMGEVVDWIARGRDLGMKIQSIGEILAMRRMHPGSMSYNMDIDKARGYVHAARRALDRKRARANLGKGPSVADAEEAP
jgi:glycosyltransferase involved in cell wall biosynthesis